jgi:hypothetical protein
MYQLKVTNHFSFLILTEVVPHPETVMTVPAAEEVPWAGRATALVLVLKVKAGLIFQMEISFSLVLLFQALLVILVTVWVLPGLADFKVPATTR